MDIEKDFKLFKEELFTFKELREKVLEYTYAVASKDKNVEAGDFIMELLPKVEQIINEFNPDLSSFKNYLNRHVKWLSLQCTKKYLKEKDKNDAFMYHHNANFKDNIVMQESKPKYHISKEMQKFLNLNSGVIQSESMRKRVTILALKNSRLLTDPIIDNLSSILGVEKKWLEGKKDQLNEKCQERIKNRDYLEIRCNRLFIDITKDQDKLNKELDINKKQEILIKLEEKKTRLHKLQETLSKRSYGPKNDEIAKVLNIPKGTVDSSLFYIKKKLSSLSP